MFPPTFTDPSDRPLPANGWVTITVAPATFPLTDRLGMVWAVMAPARLPPTANLLTPPVRVRFSAKSPRVAIEPTDGAEIVPVVWPDANAAAAIDLIGTADVMLEPVAVPSVTVGWRPPAVPPRLMVESVTDPRTTLPTAPPTVRLPVRLAALALRADRAPSVVSPPTSTVLLPPLAVMVTDVLAVDPVTAMLARAAPAPVTVMRFRFVVW